MEKILGTKTFAESVVSDIRYDAREADSLEEEENRDAARQRYQRLYWESTPEDGREPIVPASLEHAKKLAKKITKQAERHKSDPEYMPIIHNDKLFVKTKKEVISQRTGSAPIKFLDVGGKFINVDDRLRRIAGAERKAREKERRTLEAAKSLQKENPSTCFITCIIYSICPPTFRYPQRRRRNFRNDTLSKRYTLHVQ
ncbi:hypothetical protein PTI98_000776 [Pleurotus ostreatus]|nr:hypothetical protein PTI98_000776 [Pleurotus ostreatus]